MGGLFGILEALESLAGLFGPAVGGVLYRLNPLLPLAAVVLVYALVFIATLFYYRDYVVLHTTANTTSKGISISSTINTAGEKGGPKPEKSKVGRKKSYNGHIKQS